MLVFPFCISNYKYICKYLANTSKYYGSKYKHGANTVPNTELYLLLAHTRANTEQIQANTGAITVFDTVFPANTAANTANTAANTANTAANTAANNKYKISVDLY